MLRSALSRCIITLYWGHPELSLTEEGNEEEKMMLASLLVCLYLYLLMMMTFTVSFSVF